MIIKDGEVRVLSTPCDICSKPATLVIGTTAKCKDHEESDKVSSVTVSLKAFTQPLEEGKIC